MHFLEILAGFPSVHFMEILAGFPSVYFMEILAGFPSVHFIEILADFPTLPTVVGCPLVKCYQSEIFQYVQSHDIC